MAYIAHLFNTIFCMYQKEYNKKWDIKLNKLMDEDWEGAKLDLQLGEELKVTPDAYTLSFGDVQVWVGNKWYSYGYRYSAFDKISWWESCRPSIHTMMKLDRLVKFKLNEHKIKILKETTYD